MDFLGKDKLSRLDEERQQRRKARAEEAQKRLEEVGKSTQQMVQDHVSPNRNGGDTRQNSQGGLRVGGLSRVLLETATGGEEQDGRRSNRRTKRVRDLLGIQSEGNRALGAINQAMSTIQSSMVDATGAGLRGGMEGAARSVTDAVTRVANAANPNAQTTMHNPLADLMDQDAEDHATATREQQRGNGEPEHAQHHGLGGLVHGLSVGAGGFDVGVNVDLGLGQRASQLPGGFGLIGEQLEKAQAAGGFATGIGRHANDVVGNALARGEALAEKPQELIADAVNAPRELLEKATSLPREALDRATNVPRDMMARAADAPRQIADNLRDAPAHVLDNVGQVADHVSHMHGISSRELRDVAHEVADKPREVVQDTLHGVVQGIGDGPRNAVREATAAIDPRNVVESARENLDPNRLAGRAAAEFSPHHIIEGAAALGEHVGADLARNLDPRTIAQQTTAGIDPRNLMRGSVDPRNMLDPARGDASAVDPSRANPNAAPGAAQTPNAPGAAQDPNAAAKPNAQAPNAAQNPNASPASNAAPTAANATASANRPTAAGPAPAHAANPASPHAATTAHANHGATPTHAAAPHAAGGATPHNAVHRPPPAHSSAAAPTHGNPQGAAPPASGPAPGPRTPLRSPTPASERQQPSAHARQPSADRTSSSQSDSGQQTVTPQAVDPGTPAPIDRQQKQITQPSFNIDIKAPGGNVPTPDPVPPAPTISAPPATQTTTPATTNAPTTSNRSVNPLASAPPAAQVPTNPALAAGRAAAAGVAIPQGTLQPLPASNTSAAPGPSPAPAPAAQPGPGSVQVAAQAVPAPAPAQLPQASVAPTPAAPTTPTPTPPAPTVPEVKHSGGDSVPVPSTLVQANVSLSSDRSATSSAIAAEAQTQSRVAPEATAQRASQIAPLGPQMQTTGHSADAPIASANSSSQAQGSAAASTGRARENAEAQTGRAQVANQMQGAAAERAQFQAMPPPAILQQTSPAAMQPAVASAQAAVQSTAQAVAATPVHLDPAIIARGQAAGALNSTLPPFDAARFNQIDQHPPVPPLQTQQVDAAHATAAGTYSQANAQIETLANIPPPVVNAPASGSAGQKTSGGYPTREAAIAKIEQEVAQQSNSQAPAQMQSAAKSVQQPLQQHVQTSEQNARSQATQQVATATSQATDIANRPPPITGAQAAAQAQPEYQSHQQAATTAHQQMRTSISGAQSSAEGQVAAAKTTRDSTVQTATGTYNTTVQGTVMPQYQSEQTAANAQFTAQNQTAQQNLASDQTQAQAQAQAQSDAAKAKADADLASHQSAMENQRQAAVTSHQQQAQAATQQHEAQMQQQQAQMDAQVAQHQSEMHSQVSAQQTQGQQEINQHLSEGEQGYQSKIAEGTQQANAEKQKADAEAAAKKAQADAEKKKHSGGLFGSIVGWVKDAVNSLLDAVKSIIDAAKNLVISIMEKARQAAMAVLNAARQAALAVMSKVKSAIQGIISACASAITSVISACAAAVRNLIQNLANALKALVTALTNVLTALVSAFQMAVNALLDGLIAAVSLVNKDLGDKLRNATQKYRDAFNGACDKLKAGIQAAGNKLKAGIQAAADTAIAAVDVAEHALNAAVDRVANTLNAAVEAAYQLGATAINAAFDAAEWAVNKAFDAAETVVTAAFDLAKAQVSALQDAVSAVADFAIAVADKVMEAVDKIAQAVVSLIPDSWKKAFVDFWNGPWRSVIIIGLATIAAVAITVATGGLGGPIAGALLCGVIGGTIAGTAYFGGEMIARESEISLSDPSKGMYVPGYGNVQIGPDGKPVAPANLTPEQQAEFNKKAGWALSNFNLQTGPNGQVDGFERKSGSEITDYAVGEGIKGFGEGFVSSALAMAGGSLGGAAVKGFGIAAESTLGSVVSAGVTNVVTGPIQNALSGAWDAGFDAIREGKSPADALKAAYGAGSAALTDPGAWAAAILTMGVAPAKLKFIEPMFEGAAGKKIESELAQTVIKKGAGVALDTMAGTFGSVGGGFVTAYADAIAHGKSQSEALAAARKAADEAFTPEAIATTLMLSTAGAIAEPKKPAHAPGAEPSQSNGGGNHPTSESHPTTEHPPGTPASTTAHPPGAEPTSAHPGTTTTERPPGSTLHEPPPLESRTSDRPAGAAPGTPERPSTERTSATHPAGEPVVPTTERPTGSDHHNASGTDHPATSERPPGEREATAGERPPTTAKTSGALHEPAAPKQVSEHEPRLKAIARENIDGAPKETVAKIQEARTEIAKLKSERTRTENGTGKWEHATPAEREAHIKLLDDKIDNRARTALEEYDRTVNAPQTDAAAFKKLSERTPEQVAAREKEVAEARRETAERSKQLHQEVAANTVKENGALHVQEVFDHVTMGAGFAGVANETSRPPTGGKDIVIGGANPWDGAKAPLGQKVGDSNIPNAAPGHTMHETVSDPNRRFMLAGEHADNVALNKNDAGIRVFDGKSGALEPGPKGDWPAWAKEKGATVRMSVTDPDGTVRYFYSKQVDVAVGPGPARMLSEAQLDPATLKRMKAAGAFAVGDQGFDPAKIKSGDVAVYGPAAAGAWGVEASAAHTNPDGSRANNVEWMGRAAKPNENWTPEQRAHYDRIQAEMKTAHESGDPARIHAAEKANTDFLFETAPGNGNLPRNQQPGGAFDPKLQTENGGNVTRKVGEIQKVTYEPDPSQGGKERVKIQLADGSVVWKDSLVLTIGQDAAGKGGPVELVQHYAGKLEPIMGHPEPPDGFRPVVGVQSADGSIRVLGAAATPGDISRLLDQKKMTASDHQDNLRHQAAGLNEDSKGVIPGFVLAEKDIKAANNARAEEVQARTNQQLAEMIQETPAQQRAQKKQGGGLIRTSDGPMEATPVHELTPQQRAEARAKHPELITRLESGEHVTVPHGQASVDMMSSITAATGKEVALLRSPGGERFLVLGNEHSVDLPPGTKIIAHTHPGGNLQFSGEDHAALHAAGQKSSVLIGADGTAGRFRTSEKEIPANMRENQSLHEPDKVVEVKDPEKFAKFIPNADPLHKNISEQQRYEVIQDFPVKMITSAPGHQNLRSPEAMVGMSESMKKAGTGNIFEGKEPIQLNVFTDTVNGKVVVKSIEVQDGNHRLAAGLYAGKWNSIKDIPPGYLNIEVNGFDTQGTQHPRWIPLAVAQQSGIPKDQWFEVPANWGPKGPTAQVSGGVSSQDTTIPEKFRGVTLDKVIARSLERVATDGAAPPTQRRSTGQFTGENAGAIARAGTSGGGGALPHLTQIQKSFGRHDVSGVQAHVGGGATAATQALSAEAFAHGNSIAFNATPDLHTAAHEAAHVVQQRQGGVPAGVDAGAHDPHEKHADAVADAVVSGKSSEELLDSVPGGGAAAPHVDLPAVQRKASDDGKGNGGGGGGDSAVFAAQMTDEGKAADMLRHTPPEGRGEIEAIVRAKFPKTADKLIADNPSSTEAPKVHAPADKGKPAPAAKDGKGKGAAPQAPHGKLPAGGKAGALAQHVAAKHEEGIDDIGAFKGASTSDLALIHQELVEHEQWKAAKDDVGDAGSVQRAAFIAEQTGKGVIGAGVEGLATGAGGAILTKVVEKGAMAGLTKLGVAVGGEEIPGIGPIIAGAMSAYSLYTKNWKETGEKIAQFGKGSDDYEVLANSLQSIAEVIDIVVNVVNVIAGIVAAIGVVMWIVTICTLGAASPIALTLTSIAAGCVTATLILDAIAKLVLNPMILLFRAMHTFKSEADPRDVKEQGDSLSETANQTVGFLGNLAGGKIAEAGMERAKFGKTPEGHDGGTPDHAPSSHETPSHESGAPKGETHDPVAAKPHTEPEPHAKPAPVEDPHAKAQEHPDEHEPAKDPAKDPKEPEPKESKAEKQRKKQEELDKAKKKVDEAKQAKEKIEEDAERELENNREARKQAKEKLEEGNKTRDEQLKDKLHEIEGKRREAIDKAEAAREKKLEKIAEDVKTNEDALKAAKQTADAHKVSASEARDNAVEAADQKLAQKTSTADEKLAATEQANVESSAKAAQRELAQKEQTIKRAHAEAKKHLEQIEDPEVRAEKIAAEDSDFRAKQEDLARERNQRANELTEGANSEAKAARDRSVERAKEQHQKEVDKARQTEADAKAKADQQLEEARTKHDEKKTELKGDKSDANDEFKKAKTEANADADTERGDARDDKAKGDDAGQDQFDETAKELKQKNIDARKKLGKDGPDAEHAEKEAKEELDKEKHSAPYRWIRDWVVKPFFTDPFNIKKIYNEKAGSDIDALGPKDTTKAVFAKDKKEEDKRTAKQLEEAMKPKDGPEPGDEHAASGGNHPHKEGAEPKADPKAAEHQQNVGMGVGAGVGLVVGGPVGAAAGAWVGKHATHAGQDFAEGWQAGRKEEPEKIERQVSPKYADPPFPEAKLGDLRGQIEADLAQREQWADKKAKELELQGKEKGNAAKIAEAQKVAKEATEAGHAHKEAVERKDAAITAQKKRAEDAGKQGADGTHRIAGLVVLEVPLVGFNAFTGLISKLPGRVGAKFSQLHHDGEDFQAKLGQMKKMVTGSQDQSAQKGTAIQADKTTNTTTLTKNATTTTQLTGNEGKLGTAKQRVDGAVQKRGADAAQAGAQEQKSAAGAKGAQNEYAAVQGAMVAWAHQHQQARLEAKAQARARDEARKGKEPAPAAKEPAKTDAPAAAPAAAAPAHE